MGHDSWSGEFPEAVKNDPRSRKSAWAGSLKRECVMRMRRTPLVRARWAIRRRRGEYMAEKKVKMYRTMKQGGKSSCTGSCLWLYTTLHQIRHFGGKMEVDEKKQAQADRGKLRICNTKQSQHQSLDRERRKGCQGIGIEEIF